MKVSEQDINAALALLAEHYPHDTFSIWAKSSGEYTAYLDDNRKLGLGSNCAWGETAMEAALKLISEAGDRDPAAILEQRIAKLRNELAQLEAQQAKEEPESDLVKSVQA